MSENNSDDGRCSGPPGSLTAAGEQDGDSPNEREGGRDGLAAPRHRNDDCMQAYASHGLSGIGSESSPSCGWRGVYAAMEVRRDG